MHFMKRHYRRVGETMQGWRAHVPRNFFMVFCWFNILKDRPVEGFILSNMLSHAISYPF